MFEQQWLEILPFFFHGIIEIKREAYYIIVLLFSLVHTYLTGFQRGKLIAVEGCHNGMNIFNENNEIISKFSPFYGRALKMSWLVTQEEARWLNVRVPGRFRIWNQVHALVPFGKALILITESLGEGLKQSVPW